MRSGIFHSQRALRAGRGRFARPGMPFGRHQSDWDSHDAVVVELEYFRANFGTDTIPATAFRVRDCLESGRRFGGDRVHDSTPENTRADRVGPSPALRLLDSAYHNSGKSCMRTNANLRSKNLLFSKKQGLIS